MITAVLDINVIFVDDDADVRNANCQALQLAGLKPISLASPREALTMVRSDLAAVLVTDVRMPEMDGRHLVESVRAIDPKFPAIFITGHGDIASAVEAMKGGAFDFIAKPFATGRLVDSVRRALEARRSVLAERSVLAQAAHIEHALPLAGDDPVMIEVRRRVAMVANAGFDVLVSGEAGVGKETIVRAIHAASPRGGAPLQVVRCSLGAEESAALLFGARSGAHRLGAIERADGGAIYIEDIDALPLAIQARLWRVIKDREVLRPDSDLARVVDVRILASTKADPLGLLQAGALSHELAHHFRNAHIRAPALRERRQDIIPMFSFFLAEASQRLEAPIPPVSDALRGWLLQQDWPGNLRELAAIAEGLVLEMDPTDRPSGEPVASLPERISAFERGLIEDALIRHHGVVRDVLASLRIPRKTFYDKINRYKIDLESYRRAGERG